MNPLPAHTSEERCSQLALSVVLPVYNEEAGIAEVIDDIRTHVLDRVRGSELVVVDDRSTDRSREVVAGLAAGDSRIVLLINDANMGHGRSIRRAMDCSTGAWIFHLDSDGQVDVTEFALLWDRRAQADLVLGQRRHRHDPLHRLVLTRFTKVAVSVVARRWVTDANVPFKLIRRPLYEHLRTTVPVEAFAPSILIVIGALRSGGRVVEVETTHLPRRHGRSTLRLGRLARAVGIASWQTARFGCRPIAAYVPAAESRG